MTRLALIIGLVFSLSACASGPKPPPRPKLPYNHWNIALVAPRFMEVWVESVDVLDQRRLAFYRVTGGVASYTAKTEGWHKGTGGGSL